MSSETESPLRTVFPYFLGGPAHLRDVPLQDAASAYRYEVADRTPIQWESYPAPFPAMPERHVYLWRMIGFGSRRMLKVLAYERDDAAESMAKLADFMLGGSLLWYEDAKTNPEQATKRVAEQIERHRTHHPSDSDL